MGRITRALDALFDRSAALEQRNAPQPGSIQTSAQLAALFGFGSIRTATNADSPEVQIKEGFNRNVVVYRCVREIASSAASVDLVLYRKKGDDLQEVEQHELLDLMRRPNIFQGQQEFLDSWISYLVLSGNTYFQAVTVNNRRRLKELWTIRPDLVDIKMNRGFPYAYSVQTNDGQKEFPIDPITGVCEIVHTKTWNPLDPYKGISPLKAAALSTDIHNETSEWNRNLLANAAVPSGALAMKAAQGGVPNKLTDEEFERLKSELKESYQGAKNAGAPMLLEGGLEWQEMSLSPKDMDWLNTRNTSAREIALAFGVPPMLLGIPGDNTYSNQKEARLWFWEDTVLPTLSLALGSLNRFIDIQYPGQNLFFGFDEDMISALAPRREDLWARVASSDFLTVDEKREATGYEVAGGTGGKTIFIDSGKVPIDTAAEPPEPQPTALAEGDNDNIPVDQELAAETRSAVLDLKRTVQTWEWKKSDRAARQAQQDASERLINAAANRMRPAIKRHLRAVAKDAAQSIRDNDFVGVDAAVSKHSDELEAILKSSAYAVSEVTSDRFFRAFKSAHAPERKDLLGYFWSLVAPFVESHVAAAVVMISETTRKAIQGSIAEGLKEGLGFEDIASLIIKDTAIQSASRALTIAGTEAHAAATFASEASAKAVGVPMEREWAAAGGDRTRPTHREADGQRRALEVPFSVGGSSLMYPGDPAGSSKETINCRCVLIYEPTGL